jgi:carboxyl-terminal processing protease
MSHRPVISSILIIFLLSIGINCGKDAGSGILGIQVPVGSGKVSKKNPYKITGVYENTPAHKAGVKPDDVILQINDTPVSNGMEYDYIYKNLLLGKAGEKITLVVKRMDKKIIIEIIRARRE